MQVSNIVVLALNFAYYIITFKLWTLVIWLLTVGSVDEQIEVTCNRKENQGIQSI